MIAFLLACNDQGFVDHSKPPPHTGPNIPPVAIPGPGGDVERGEPIDLDGTDSYDLDHAEAVLTYEWTVLESPPGSAPVISDPLVAQPAFSADLLGRYRLGLVVTDEGGAPSTNRADVIVEVIPYQDLEVELTWNMPVDLDLHLIEPGGTYSTLSDCSYFNPAPDWGAPGDLTDDPLLENDVDATGGPETIRLAQPDEAKYAIAVTYWNSRELVHRDTVPHLVIRAEGRDIVTVDDVPTLMAEGDVWLVGTFDWSTLTFDADGTMTTHEALGGPPYNE